MAQGRGTTFIDPQTEVYEGMIIGLNARADDIAVNVTKQKQKTNIRSSTSDISVKLVPPVRMSLEESMDFLADDELLEVTPRFYRLRKRILDTDTRQKANRRS